VFPAGGVSTAAGPFARRALDATWKPFTARAIIETQATVVPMVFEGRNSRLFQIASHLSRTLREALLFYEMRNKLGATVRVRIGAPLNYLELEEPGDRHALIGHLRRVTYALDETGGEPHPRRRLSRRPLARSSRPA
jgi:putative hemolysin